MSQGIKDWQVIVREELLLKLDLVTLMVVKEIGITYCMASHSVALGMGLHWRGHPLTHTHRLPAETITFRTVPVWLKASEVNAMLDVKRLQEFLVSRRDTTQLHLMSRTMRWKHCSQCYWKRQLRGLLGSLVNTLK